MPRKAEIEQERDELRAKLAAAKAIIDDALGFDDDEGEDSFGEDDDVDGDAED